MSAALAEVFVSLTKVDCGGCGIAFAVPTAWHSTLREKGGSFRCPNPSCAWNSQSYTESENARLKKQLEEKQRRLDFETNARRSAEAERNKAIAAKNRQTKRVAKGVCPCCNRTFQNLQRHMATKHPGAA